MDYFTNISYRGNTLPVSFWKELFCGVGGASAIIFLGWDVVATKKRYFASQSSAECLLKFNKRTFLRVLKAEGYPFDNIDIRIFVPQTKVQKVWRWIRRKQTWDAVVFNIKNIHPLAEAGITNSLMFQVYPEPEGLVGVCYTSKKVVFERDLHHPLYQMKLTEDQKDLSENQRFCLCVPVKREGKVVAIVTMDHEKPVNRVQDNAIKDKWAPIMKSFARQMYLSVPLFFKGGNHNGNHQN